jgi:nitrile hydratase accessory protein
VSAAIGDGDGDGQGVPPPPGDGDGPVFAETWQADAFATVQTMVDAGVFTPHEWSDALAAAITAAHRAGDPDLGNTYYDHWATALEALCTANGLVTEAAVNRRQREWESAYEETPHGQPVELSASRLTEA